MAQPLFSRKIAWLNMVNFISYERNGAWDEKGQRLGASSFNIALRL
jgi:hypothetical protein